MPPGIRFSSPVLLVFAAVSVSIHAADPPRSEKFSGPPREPPSRDFDFLHLRLDCSFDWAEKCVEGTVSHRVRSYRKGARFLELDAVAIDARGARDGSGRDLAIEKLPDKLRVDLGRDTAVGEEVSVEIRYRAHPRMGLYFYRPEEKHPDIPLQLWTQGETEEARHWIPCFDHPSDKLTTEVRAKVPKPLSAISNGKLLSTEEAGEHRIFHWHQDKPHATYLISLVAGDFAVWRGQAGKVALAGYVAKRDEALAARSFELTGDMMAFFEAKTGHAYPWDKYDQLCVHGFNFGGMENTSATTLTEATLHDERAALDHTSMDLVAHELAHQWFGDLVTCKDWGDIWLNESFATFFANLYREHRLGWDEGVYDRYEDGEKYKGEDRNRYRRAIATRGWKSPNDMFDAHSYPKGGRVLGMLRYLLGDERFFAGIKLYLDRHSFRSVETADFRMAMEDATGTSLSWFFDQWIESGGHPSYKVSSSWVPEEKAVRVEVEQVQKTDDLTPLFRMPVVIAVIGPDSRAEHRVVVAERKHTFTFPAPAQPRLVRFDPGDWILKDLDHSRTREELLYQLSRDPDAMGRREAAEALARDARDRSVLDALLGRLGQETFWGVRLQVVKSLASSKLPAVKDALVASLRTEPKSRVRAEILRALGDHGGGDVVQALRDSFARDPSYVCAAAALRALGSAAKSDAREAALAALDRDSHEDVIRSAAIDVLAADLALPDDERASDVKRIAVLATEGKTDDVRSAALEALGKIGTGKDAALDAATKALDDPRVRVRLNAIEALARLGDRRAIPSLEARKARELPAVFHDPVGAITRAIARIEGRTDVKTLQEDVRRLRAVNEDLERRLSELEKRGRTASF